MRRIVKQLVGTALVLSLGVTSLAGCAKKSSEAEAGAGVTKVIVGTGNAYEPYCYLDENGELAGYEYNVL
jgi:L-cystine transport system substrate-binding protein